MEPPAIMHVLLVYIRSQSRRCAQGWTSTWRWLT
jgi:hypothetical protein